MKKIGLLLLGTFMSLMLFTTSCGFMVGAAQGYNAAEHGYSIIGSASSASKCKTKCANAGYTGAYYYYPNTKNCFCK